jgi:hypothetical protein
MQREMTGRGEVPADQLPKYRAEKSPTALISIILQVEALLVNVEQTIGLAHLLQDSPT